MIKHVPLILSCVLLIAAVYLDNSGTYLAPVLVGMALVTGATLLVAAAALSNAKWIEPVRSPLLATAPLLFIFPFLVRLAPFPWLAHETAWLRADFFLVRNQVMLLVLAIVGNVFAKASRHGAPSVRFWAVIYIFTFVTTKSLVAMDWVMSFDFPWISTMFPVLYMVESLYAGIALAGIVCFVLTRRGGAVGGTLYDVATLFFGFALFWGGLFFAQYLTIWYGNIPEEVYYYTHRFHLPGGTEYQVAAVLLLFAIPFFSLLVHRWRKSADAVFFLTHLALVGLLVYRVFHIFPYVSLNLGFLVIQSLAMFGLIAWATRSGLEVKSR